MNRTSPHILTRALIAGAVALAAALSACADDAGRDPVADAGADTSADTPDDAGTDANDDAALDAAVDANLLPRAPVCEGSVLFGAPEALTGLDGSQCGPVCACDGEPWTPPVYDDTFLSALGGLTLREPFAEVTGNPYTETPPSPDPDAVCGVLLHGDGTYSLQTWGSWGEALAAGAHVTHTGGCGVCSTLENLAVYIRETDLTAPVRECGLLGLREGFDANLACVRELGFDLPCAQIWTWNTQNTRDACLELCLAALDEPYHLPDGALNPCLQCDEDISGPVFKHVAGRTRRNSGLANALCRPCTEVHRIEHDYGLR